MSVPKHLWGEAFKEGKAMADHVLRLNREQKKHAKQAPDSVATDRELVLSAAIQVFWDYRMGKEASDAARILMWERIEDFIESSPSYDHSCLKTRRLLKAIRRLKNDEASNGFLRMWVHVERFMGAAVNDEFWKNYSDPKQAVRALVNDLSNLANLGEERDQEERQDEEGGSGAEWPEGSEGDLAEAHQGAVPRESEQGLPPLGRADEGGGGVQGGGSGLEANEGQPQKSGEGPHGADQEAPSGG